MMEKKCQIVKMTNDKAQMSNQAQNPNDKYFFVLAMHLRNYLTEYGSRYS